MHIPNEDAQYYLFCRLKLVFETLEQLTVNLKHKSKIKIQVLKVVKPTKKENIIIIILWGLV